MSDPTLLRSGAFLPLPQPCRGSKGAEDTCIRGRARSSSVWRCWASGPPGPGFLANFLKNCAPFFFSDLAPKSPFFFGLGAKIRRKKTNLTVTYVIFSLVVWTVTRILFPRVIMALPLGCTTRLQKGRKTRGEDCLLQEHHSRPSLLLCLHQVWKQYAPRIL